MNSEHYKFLLESMRSWTESAIREIKQVHKYQGCDFMTEWSDNHVYHAARLAIRRANDLIQYLDNFVAELNKQQPQ